MKKQKINLAVIKLLGVFLLLLFAGKVQANGGATVWWNATTDDTGVTGYKIFYSTSAISCANWNAASLSQRTANSGSTTPLLPSTPTPIIVIEANTLRNPLDATKRGYTFNNGTLLSAMGSTYNFVVVASDAAGNLSSCATADTAGNPSVVSKQVSYVANVNTEGASAQTVDIADFSTFFENFGNTACGNLADFTGQSISTRLCAVDIQDFNILFTDFGKSY